MNKNSRIFIMATGDMTVSVMAYLIMTTESFPKEFGYGFLILMIIAYYLDCKVNNFKMIYFWTKLAMFFVFLGIVWMVSYSFPAYGGLWLGGFMGAFAANINARFLKSAE